MDRRNFLKGTIGGVTAGGIIIAAGVPDTQAFMEQVKVGDPVAAAIQEPGTIDMGHILFNSDGKPVAVITSIDYRQGRVDATRMDDAFQRFAPGYKEVTLTATVMGYTSIANGGKITNEVGHDYVFDGNHLVPVRVK